MAAQGKGRAGTTTTAAFLILAVTAFFILVGIELIFDALNASNRDRETTLSGLSFGLTPEEQSNFSGILAAIVLGLCLLTTALGVGVLTRRESMRHATIATFVMFTVITIPLAIAGLTADPPSNSAWFGVLIGLVDATIVWLILMPKTANDFERAESARRKAEWAREAEREARRERRLSGRS